MTEQQQCSWQCSSCCYYDYCMTYFDTYPCQAGDDTEAERTAREELKRLEESLKKQEN